MINYVAAYESLVLRWLFSLGSIICQLSAGAYEAELLIQPLHSSIAPWRGTFALQAPLFELVLTGRLQELWVSSRSTLLYILSLAFF